jgi:hypothetical protein
VQIERTDELVAALRYAARAAEFVIVEPGRAIRTVSS